MNPEDEILDPPPAPGPIEQAYLHGHILPDDQPEGHPARPSSDSLLFPEPQSSKDSPDDVGMFV